MLSVVTGGQRGSRWRIYHGLIATMVVCGIWHGATWNFLISGAIHGVLLVVHRMFGQFCETRPRLTSLLSTIPGTAARVALTFLYASR